MVSIEGTDCRLLQKLHVDVIIAEAPAPVILQGGLHIIQDAGSQT
jgi:hypothetical protein